MNSNMELELPEPQRDEGNVPAYIIRKRAKNREYWAANKERMRPIQNRNQKRRRAERWGTDIDYRAYLLAQSSVTRAKSLKSLCACCSFEQFVAIYRAAVINNAEVDHIIAYCNGGKHCCKNLQILSIEGHKEKTRKDFAILVPRRLAKNRRPVMKDLFS